MTDALPDDLPPDCAPDGARTGFVAGGPGASLSRRALVGGLIALAGAGPALAEAPARSPRPPARPGFPASTPASTPAGAGGTTVANASARVGAAVRSIEDLIAEARLGGQIGIALVDARSGRLLEAHQPDLALPPASVAKAATAIYAQAALGAGHRFTTRVIATGPIRAGVLQGDLVLAGGGDPTLATDALGDLVAQLWADGLRRVTGRFLVWQGALPYARAIDPDQPDHLAYNPAVSGLNLNFNRLHFEWRRAGQGWDLGLDARDRRFQPQVYSARIQMVAREAPLFTYSDRGPLEDWTVASAGLKSPGSRWLPVRRPALYAGDVFQTLARARGLALASPEAVARLPQGQVIAQAQSQGLRPIMADMLKYSNNLTAEALGMAASRALRGGLDDHPASGALMTASLGRAVDLGGARFVDHSGLGAGSRISAAAMVRLLQQQGPGQDLRPLLKEFTLRDAQNRPMTNHPIRVDAKTGTLNFVSTLAGWMTAPSGAEMVFAIFTGDLARRAALSEAQRERPPGGREWIARSKRLQQQLIERWAATHGA